MYFDMKRFMVFSFLATLMSGMYLPVQAYYPSVSVKVKCDDIAKVESPFRIDYVLEYDESAIVDGYKPQFVLVNQLNPMYAIKTYDQTDADSTPAIANPDNQMHFTDTYTTTLVCEKSGRFYTPSYYIVCGKDTLASEPVRRLVIANDDAEKLTGKNRNQSAPTPIITITPEIEKDRVTFGERNTVVFWLESDSEITGISTKIDRQHFIEAYQLPYEANLTGSEENGKMVYRACVGRYELLATDIGTYKTPVLHVNVGYRIKAKDASNQEKTYTGELHLKSNRTKYKVVKAKKQ